jgi:hypothetical protein
LKVNRLINFPFTFISFKLSISFDASNQNKHKLSERSSILSNVDGLGLIKSQRFGEYICFHLHVGRRGGILLCWKEREFYQWIRWWLEDNVWFVCKTHLRIEKTTNFDDHILMWYNKILWSVGYCA